MLKYTPGFALILAISLPAWFIQDQITVNGRTVVSAIAIVILLGILIRNLIGVPDGCKPGTRPKATPTRKPAKKKKRTSSSMVYT